MRRTTTTLLVAQGVAVKLTQEMLRHVRITLELYAQSSMAAKLQAQEGYGRHVGTRTPDLYRVKVAL
jgi:hypothetical protein